MPSQMVYATVVMVLFAGILRQMLAMFVFYKNIHYEIAEKREDWDGYDTLIWFNREFHDDWNNWKCKEHRNRKEGR